MATRRAVAMSAGLAADISKGGSEPPFCPAGGNGSFAMRVQYPAATGVTASAR